jgi:hypothetical protein
MATVFSLLKSEPTHSPRGLRIKAFVGFFGITRSLPHTIQSIQDNALAPLRASGATVRLYGHFHLPQVIDNPRSGEINLPADPRDSALLALDACLMERQDERLIADKLAEAKRFPDILSDEYRSARNLCFQLRSLARLWDLMAAEVGASDAVEETWVAFLRPDLRYLDPFPWQTLLPSMRDNAADLAVPGWHDWGGLNDRFAVATPRAAALYAQRGVAPGAAIEARQGLHGESLLAHIVRCADLRVVTLPVRAVRMRANGLPEQRDLSEFNLEAPKS